MSVNFSFIIPHKNRPDLLQRCVDSIPFRKDIQIVIVDDNSDEAKKPSIKREGVEIILLDSTQSKGAGRARNVGLKRATGKWLLFPDSDDYYSENIEDFLDSHIDEECDIVYFNFNYLDGTTFKELPPLFFQKEFELFNNTKTAIETIKFHHNVPWTKMISNNYLKTHNLFFEEVVNGNDILFSMMAGYFTDNIMVEKSPIYVYLKNNNSILTSKETVNSALCRLTHLIKLNSFFVYINHSEWKCSIIKRIIKYISILGLPFLYSILRSSIYIYKNRNEWCKMVYSKTNGNQQVEIF